MFFIYTQMENIINKLNKIEDDDCWEKWTLEEKKKLLDLYLIISKKESHIFNLICNYHGCDSWEDIFRDYDSEYLEDKKRGVEIAINKIDEKIKSNKNK